jgi:hypothetical protein
MLDALVFRIKKDYPALLSWAVLLLSILALFANYSQARDDIQWTTFFNSDTLGLPSLYNDLILDKGHFKDWIFANAPTIFPDILLYFFIRALHFDFVTAFMLYGIIQTSAITYLCIYIYKKLVPEIYQPYKWLIPIFIAFTFLEGVYFSEDYFFPFLMLTYSFHIGSLLNCLIFLSIFVSPISKVKKLIFLFFFGTLAVFSDKLFIVMLVLPLCGALIISVIKSKEYKNVLLYIGLMVIGCITAIKIYDYINEHRIATFTAPHKLYAFDSIKPSAERFFNQMLQYAQNPSFRGICVIFTFASVFVVAFYFFRRRRSNTNDQKILSIFYILFVFSVIGAPIINGNYSGIDTLRYNVAPFFFASVPFALFIAMMVKGRNNMLTKSISLVFILFLFGITVSKVSLSGLSNYVDFYPYKVAEIDSVAKKYNLKRGVAEYWTAKKITMFSRNNVKVYSVYENLNIQELGANIHWFWDKEFDFIVANKLAPGPILQALEVKDTVVTPNYTILIMGHFTYPKGYQPVKLQ